MQEDKKNDVTVESPDTFGNPDEEGGGRVEVVEERVARLQGEVEEARAAAAASEDRYLRERAELENFKKRMQREKSDALRFASEGLVRDLLPVFDNLERALEHTEPGSDGQSLADGVRMVLDSAIDVLARFGVTRLDVVGKPFDPALHEALAQVADSGRGPNRVVEQFLPGYTLHERLLRPARVSVSAKSPVETTGSDD